MCILCWIDVAINIHCLLSIYIVHSQLASSRCYIIDHKEEFKYFTEKL